MVDDRVAYVGGMNFSEHNAAWHDMMLRITDRAAVAFLREDFLSTWEGHDRKARAEFAAWNSTRWMAGPMAKLLGGSWI